MISLNQRQGVSIYRLTAALLMVAPVLLVIASTLLPEGERGDLMVYGLEVILSIVGVGLIVGAIYALGASNGAKVRAAHINQSAAA